MFKFLITMTLLSHICLASTAITLDYTRLTPGITAMNPEARPQKTPAWYLSKNQDYSSLQGSLPALPENAQALRIEIAISNADTPTDVQGETVFSINLTAQDDAGKDLFTLTSRPVRFRPVASQASPLWVELEPCVLLKNAKRLQFSIIRRFNDPADTLPGPVAVSGVRVTPIDVPPQPIVVEGKPGYNSWPVIQAIGSKLVCVYSYGDRHGITECDRGVYARTSTDGGKTWTPETLVVNHPDSGDVTIGKGLDNDGAMLVWIRCAGPNWHHELYKTTDGVQYQLLSMPKLDPMPMQITDVIHVPTVGLFCLWFAGDYGDKPTFSWGTLSSADNGKTWTQHTIEANLDRNAWPTEPCPFYMGDGKILAISRSESWKDSTLHSQHQLESSDYGKTWTHKLTNISDVSQSTPTLLYDAETGLLSQYYFHRGRGFLKRRTVTPAKIWNHPLDWPVPDVVCLGSESGIDAGNVNGTQIGSTHYLAFYSGNSKDTSIVVIPVPAPKTKGNYILEFP